jgi:hypothetical protein
MKISSELMTERSALVKHGRADHGRVGGNQPPKARCYLPVWAHGSVKLDWVARGRHGSDRGASLAQCWRPKRPKGP